MTNEELIEKLELIQKFKCETPTLEIKSAARYQKSSNCVGIRGVKNYRKSIFWNSNNSQNNAGVQFATTGILR